MSESVHTGILSDAPPQLVLCSRSQGQFAVHDSQTFVQMFHDWSKLDSTIVSETMARLSEPLIVRRV